MVFKPNPFSTLHLYATAEINTLISTDNAHNPYGQSTDSYHDVIALGESWAYYMGHYLADKEYGNIAGCQIE